MRPSVIIPALNEADRIGETIARVRACGDSEIIVVDGGSEDATLTAAQGADQRITSARGRAAQQNAGATASSGDLLLFLHADCWPEPGAFEAIETSLTNPKVIGGCFTQIIDAGGWKYRLLERGNACRVKFAQWVYGDQGLFVRREVFERVGCFPNMELMEDLSLAKRLKHEGRLMLLDHRLHVSARRWQRVGVVRQTLRNWAFVGLSHCGMSPRTLARRYHEVR